jgi:SAM-dependent methyltransferase
MNDRQQWHPNDNPFYCDNVYGHALELLARHRRDAAGKIHLDIGCGFGRIAEPLREALGVDYVGSDANPAGLASLSARGFETSELVLDDEETTYLALARVAAGRPVASISILNTLEHLSDPSGALRAIRRLASDHDAFVLLSVPNIAHRDVGFRLAFGLWDYTEIGLLDHTHRMLFGDASLRRMLASCGLHIIDANDVPASASEQSFPPDHPVLAQGTALHRILAKLRDGVDRFAETCQFVRLCLPGPVEMMAPFVTDRNPPRPFLSVVTRTQGTRPHGLAEVFTCLAGQTNIDFELLVLGHRMERQHQVNVERLIHDNPKWLRDKIRLIRVDSGNRTRPLNEGFAAARGHYIAILDDDDMPFANWVETFVKLAQAAPGRLLRAVTVRQDVRNVEVLGRPGIRAESAPQELYPSKFDYLAHLRVNQSPPVSVAFPRGVFQELNITFDETLTTTEDWDYILRVAGLVGAESSPQVTSIYRWWVSDDSSRTQHGQDEWDRNHARILNKLDQSPLVFFPPGTTARIRYLLNTHDRALGETEIEWPAGPESRADKDALREVIDLYTSTSWRVTAPVRLIGRLLGRPVFDRNAIWRLSPAGLRRLAQEMRASTSWRITAPIRAVRHWSPL